MSQAYPSAPPPAYDDVNRRPPPGQEYKAMPEPQPYPPAAAQYGQDAAPYGQGAAPYGPAGTHYGQGTGYQSGPAPVDNVEAGQAFNASSFSDKTLRRKFIMKVYLILMLQMIFTAGLVALFVLIDPVRLWVRRNLWFYILAYVTFLITYIVLVCCPTVRRKYPGNYIALVVFTMSFAYVAAAIASYHSAQAVLIAAGITAAVSLAISLFAIQTKIDFTMCSGLIFAASITLLVAGLLFMFVAIFVTENRKTYFILQCVYGTIAALIISLFLVFDTQRIVGGKNRKYALSPEEHIIGAMELYLDIVYIFLIILACSGNQG